MTKTFNPLTLDTKKDKPTFVGNSHKWWLIAVSPSKRFCGYVAEHVDTMKKTYVLIDNKTQTVVRDTTSLEDLDIYMHIFDRCLFEEVK